MEMGLRGKKAVEMRMRIRIRIKVGDVCCRGVGMEMGLRRVVIVSLLAVGSSGEEEAEFKSFDHFYRDARCYSFGMMMKTLPYTIDIFRKKCI